MEEGRVEKNLVDRNELKIIYRNVANIIHPDKFKGRYTAEIHSFADNIFKILTTIYDSNDRMTNENRSDVQNEILSKELRAFYELAIEMVIILNQYNNGVLERTDSKVESVFKFDQEMIKKKMKQNENRQEVSEEMKQNIAELKDEYYNESDGKWLYGRRIIEIVDVISDGVTIKILLNYSEVGNEDQSVFGEMYKDDFEKEIKNYSFYKGGDLEDELKNKRDNFKHRNHFNKSEKKELEKKFAIGEKKLYLQGASSVWLKVCKIYFKHNKVFLDVEINNRKEHFKLSDFEKKFTLIE